MFRKKKKNFEFNDSWMFWLKSQCNLGGNQKEYEIQKKIYEVGTKIIDS
jgi:hypothetical protein